MTSARILGRVLAGVLAATTIATGARCCPKLIMFDGPSIKNELDAKSAHYWGHLIGLQGLFLDNVMDVWQSDVGSDPRSPTWIRTKRMQDIYAREGVTDNFIKVAIWRPHDWQDPVANKAVATNFAHAAALARFAGLRGIALDLEPYVPIWGGAAGDGDIAGIVRAEGKRIGAAMRAAYPDMTIVIIKDALLYASLRQGYHGGYGLAVPFLQGLLSANFPQVVIAEEQSYKDMHVAATDADIASRYSQFLRENHIRAEGLTVAPGLWPLGLSYSDKSARVSPADFAKELQESYSTANRYVWIYAFGSAWDPGGAYPGPLVSNFGRYVGAVRRQRDSCGR